MMCVAAILPSTSEQEQEEGDKQQHIRQNSKEMHSVFGNQKESRNHQKGNKNQSGSGEQPFAESEFFWVIHIFFRFVYGAPTFGVINITRPANDQSGVCIKSICC